MDATAVFHTITGSTARRFPIDRHCWRSSSGKEKILGRQDIQAWDQTHASRTKKLGSNEILGICDVIVAVSTISAAMQKCACSPMLKHAEKCLSATIDARTLNMVGKK